MTYFLERGARVTRALRVVLLLALALPAAAQDARELYQRGADAFADGLFSNAVQSFDALAERYPDSELRADATFLLALAHYHLGHHANSYDLLGSFARLFPDSEHVAVLGHWQAAIRLAQGRATEAVERAERQLERTDTPPEYRWRTLLLHATALEQDGRAEDAERAYLALVDELPASQQADALFRAGQLAYQAGRYAEAVGDLRAHRAGTFGQPPRAAGAVRAGRCLAAGRAARCSGGTLQPVPGTVPVRSPGGSGAQAPSVPVPEHGGVRAGGAVGRCRAGGAAGGRPRRAAAAGQG